MEADLAAWGKVIRLETVGRRTGATRIATIGFVESEAGSLLVAASAATTGWAANLRAQPACTVELDGRRRPFVAVDLDADLRASAITKLILKYGTPAERLGAGPAFRLDPRP